jgi:hypothetical protein
MHCVIGGHSTESPDEGSEHEPEEEADSSEDSLPECGVVYRLSKMKVKKLADGMQQYEEIGAKLLSRVDSPWGQEYQSGVSSCFLSASALLTSFSLFISLDSHSVQQSSIPMMAESYHLASRARL